MIGTVRFVHGVAALRYLDLKQTSLPLPSQIDPRILFTEQHHDIVKEKQLNDLEVHLNIFVPPKPIIQKQLKKNTSAVRKTKTIQWETVKKITINTEPIMGKSDEYLNHYLCNHFLPYMKRSSNKSKGMSIYSCKLSSKSNHWGLYKIKSEIIRLPPTEGGFGVQLQVFTNDDCQCHLYTRKVRGLSKEVFSKINAMV